MERNSGRHCGVCVEDKSNDRVIKADERRNPTSLLELLDGVRRFALVQPPWTSRIANSPSTQKAWSIEASSSDGFVRCNGAFDALTGARPGVSIPFPCGAISMASPQRALFPNPTPQSRVSMRVRRRRPRFLWWWASVAFIAGALLWYFTLGSENQGNPDQSSHSNSYSAASLVRSLSNLDATEIG